MASLKGQNASSSWNAELQEGQLGALLCLPGLSVEAGLYLKEVVCTRCVHVCVCGVAGDMGRGEADSRSSANETAFGEGAKG